MKKQMVDYLNKNDLCEEDVCVKIKTTWNSFELENAGLLEDSFPFVQVSFELDNKNDSIQVGHALFRLINSKGYSDSEIREIADYIDLSLYQSVAAVKIYPDKFSAFLEESLEFTEHNLMLKDLSRMTAFNAEHSSLIGGYSPGYERYTYENNEFSPNTVVTYGRILVLEDISFFKKYNKRFITEHFVKIMLIQFKLLEWFDWVIVNPNIDEEYLKEHNYPASTSQASYQKFWESFKFLRSEGKLHNGDYCLVWNV